MPTTVSYPGVYIEEVPSGIRTIVGVATSITVFIGSAKQGFTDKAVRIQNFGDFERQFGDLWVRSSMSYAVQQFFLNGGTDAYIVRVVHKNDNNDNNNAKKASAPVGGLALEAVSEGEWPHASDEKTSLAAEIQLVNENERPRQPGEGNVQLFNLFIKQVDRDNPENIERQTVLERFLNLSVVPEAKRFVTQVLKEESSLVRVVTDPNPGAPPGEEQTVFTGGQDGSLPTYDEYGEAIDLLEKVDLFNLMCIPPRERGVSLVETDGGKALLPIALAYCQKRRAMLIVDPPNVGNKSVTNIRDDIDALNLKDKNAVIYFPNVKMADARKENRLEEFPPCGVVAGIFARTDAQRGVWKAPAGIEATIAGARGFSYKLTDGENGQLNPFGINCLRNFPVYGNVVWGARTMAGADQLASEWKYLPVRRLALFIEESLYRGTQWVVFEPNDEPLWAQIRLNIGAFMNNLFRQGAFQGKSPKEAYLVKCDSETTTQNDINLGIVNIVVGFAPLKPAEFVIIKFQQLAGQIET